ncbi:Bestrophin, RFP-TM, chloride channel-domain-containing protein [Abortiporus biennis]|nr:Bestrophin, RFP-TM, chloride channel-domain-containing protein [Abortiporus biennis]
MVATNPLFQGSFFSLKKFQATVVNDIWPEVLFFSLVATMVSLVSKLTSTSLAISSAMLTVLGTVLGLVISFRTSTAYERFMEGRKLWTSISIASRNLATVIWIHVPFDRIDKATGEKKSKLHVVIEKKSMINLHLLRGEGGVYYADLYPLISLLPRYSNPHSIDEQDMLPLWKASEMDHKAHDTLRTRHCTPEPTIRHTISDPGQPSDYDEKNFAATEVSEDGTKWYSSLRAGNSHKKKFDPEAALPDIPSEHPLKPSRNPPSSGFFDYFPFLRILRPLTRPIRRALRHPPRPEHDIAQRSFTGKKIRPDIADSNVPSEITLYLSTYFAWLMRNGLLTPASATTMVNSISQLQDVVANLERIRNTPLPFAYQAHLRISLWLYLFFLPFQVFAAFGYLTIPATAFASFLLIGFLEIGQEIENPFNYDLNDLDLDHFCLSIQRELHEVTAHTVPEPDSFMFTEWNQPFAPADRRSAKAMMFDTDHDYHGPETGMASIRRTLLKSWREVDQATRR